MLPSLLLLSLTLARPQDAEAHQLHLPLSASAPGAQFSLFSLQKCRNVRKNLSPLDASASGSQQQPLSISEAYESIASQRLWAEFGCGGGESGHGGAPAHFANAHELQRVMRESLVLQEFVQAAVLAGPTLTQAEAAVALRRLALFLGGSGNNVPSPAMPAAVLIGPKPGIAASVASQASLAAAYAPAGAVAAVAEHAAASGRGVGATAAALATGMESAAAGAAALARGTWVPDQTRIAAEALAALLAPHAALATGGDGVSAEDATLVRKLLASFAALLPPEPLERSDENAAVVVATPVEPSVIADLKVAAHGSLRVTAPRIAAAADLLVQSLLAPVPQEPSDAFLEDAYHNLRALRVIQQLKTAPVVVRLQSHAVSVPAAGAGETAPVKVSVVDLVGNSVSATAVSGRVLRLNLFDGESVTEATSERGWTEVQEMVTLTAGSDGTFELDSKLLSHSGAAAEPGHYRLELAVSLSGRSAPAISEHHITVRMAPSPTAPGTVVEVRAGVSQARAVTAKTTSVISSQGGFGGAHGSAVSHDVVHVALKVRTAGLGGRDHVQQATLRFRNKATGAEAAYALTVGKKKDSPDTGSYTLTVPLGEEVARFNYASGDYDLDLLVSDPLAPTATVWHLGSARLEFPPKPRQEFPLYSRPLLFDSDTALKPLPVIAHKFREPEARPAPAVSALFTALAVLPAAGLIVAALAMGNFGVLEHASTQQKLWSISFLGSFAAMLYLLVSYFRQGTAFETLSQLFAAGIVTSITGQRALSSLSQLRANQNAA